MYRLADVIQFAVLVLTKARIENCVFSAVTCRFPGNPKDGTVSPSQVSYEVGDAVSYECREGFKLVGRKSRKCSSTGLFDGIAPLCSRTLFWISLFRNQRTIFHLVTFRIIPDLNSNVRNYAPQ